MAAEADQTRRALEVGGRTVIVHDAPTPDGCRLTLFWLGGTPHSGALLIPHIRAAQARGVRLVSVARPGFGGSDRLHGRTVGVAAIDVVAVADLLGVERFAVMGYSGGGPHALAVGALAGQRVIGIAAFASPAPFSDASWFEGMRDPSALLSALTGREARTSWEKTAQFEPEQFTDDDYVLLEGPLKSLGDDVGRAGDTERGGSIDDDLALVAPWGVDLADVAAPVQLVHGTEDRVVPFAHAQRIHRLIGSSQITPLPGRGHVGVLIGWEDALHRILVDASPTA